MTYILRAAVHEDQWERQLADILSLSQKAGIGEVMLMEQSHQIMMAP